MRNYRKNVGIFFAAVYSTCLFRYNRFFFPPWSRQVMQSKQQAATSAWCLPTAAIGGMWVFCVSPPSAAAVISVMACAPFTPPPLSPKHSIPRLISAHVCASIFARTPGFVTLRLGWLDNLFIPDDVMRNTALFIGLNGRLNQPRFEMKFWFMGLQERRGGCRRSWRVDPELWL